ncbi:MAG: sulfur carrier protein ThiS [Thermomicrobiales bacterium]
MLITNRGTSHVSLPVLADAAVDGGVDAVQVREKDLHGDELLSAVEAVRDAVAGRAAVIVNGDLDVAQRLRVGLHLPEHAVLVEAAREILPGDMLIGRSIHSPRSAAEARDVDYVIAGHVFATPSKRGLSALGLDGFAAIVSTAVCPVLAIGGIDEQSVTGVLSRGAHGIAVISAINNAPDPRAAARRLRARIDDFLETEMESQSSLTQVVLTINGKPVELNEGTTISAFLTTKGLTERMVVVELNGSVLHRTVFSSTVLRDGDQVEMVHAVGGG